MKYTEAMAKLLRQTGSPDREESISATHKLAKALELPLRKGVMSGSIVDGIFEEVVFEPGAVIEWPLDFVAPGTEKSYVAYTIPNHGRIPDRVIESDYLTVPTFEVANSISWLLKYARDARWDIVDRATQVFEAGFIKKKNDDCFHAILGAAVDRNILVYDSAANAGQFTKRLVSLMKSTMRRQGGGNSTSLGRGKLTDLFISPEGLEDIRDWGVDQVDEVTRREIFTAEDGTINRIFGVNLHDIDELGVGQEYQTFFTNELGGSLESSDVELVVGVDVSNRDAFIMPIREELQVFEDSTLHRKRMAGIYGWMEYGVAVADNRRVLAGSF